MDFLHPLSGFLVGLLVGLTGVGGGSLMAPLMILLLGVAPTTAVGTDLWFAAITKMVGGTIHHSQGHADWQVVRRLALGSLPAALLTLWYLSSNDMSQIKTGLIVQMLGGILIVTALITLFNKRLDSAAAKVDLEGHDPGAKSIPALTVVSGIVLGVLVTLTSVGAGALGATMLVMLYPRRMTPQRVVGTDIVHAVPLTLIAGLGHFWMGNVDLVLLGSLLIGSIPGIIIGSKLAARINGTALRWALGGMILFSGIRLLS